MATVTSYTKAKIDELFEIFLDGTVTDFVNGMLTNLPGLPRTVTGTDYAMLWRSKIGRRTLMALKEDGVVAVAGLELVGGTRKSSTDPNYAFGIISQPEANHKFGKSSDFMLDADGRVPDIILDRWAVRMGSSATVTYTYVHVRKTPGVGEYATLKAANAAIVDASKNNQYIIIQHPGDYRTAVVADWNWQQKDYVHFVGTERDAVLNGPMLPDNSTDADITNTAAWFPGKVSKIANMTVHAKNCRYVIHDESNNTVKDYEHIYDNVVLQHFGNQAAKDWRTANPGSGMSAGTVWGVTNTVGYGASSGGRQIMRYVKSISGQAVWTMHDREDFDDGSYHLAESCELYSTDAAPRIVAKSLGAGKESTVEFRSCATNASHVIYDDDPWITQTADNQVANHAQVTVIADGDELIGFQSTCRGKAFNM